MTWLVTGGAGYIGSHIVRSLRSAGLNPVVFDNLSTGRTEFVPPQTPLVHGDILDTEHLRSTLQEHAVTGVIHVAGFKYAGVSVSRPLHTYEQNVDGTRSVLQAMHDVRVHRIVFSSSAAVYGNPRSILAVTEGAPKAPTSPYGESKLIGEWLIRRQAAATAYASCPLTHTSLRYFNVVGSSDLRVFDASEHNLFPLAFNALSTGQVPEIRGTDYSTPDGTAVRDYVHVGDIADAHAVAARRLSAGERLQPAYNLGSGHGLSVREVLDAMARVTGNPFTPRLGARRTGDPDRIVASGELAARDLEWRMRHSIDDMAASGWNAHIMNREESAVEH